MMEESVEDLKAQLTRAQHEYELSSRAEDALVKRVVVLTKALGDLVSEVTEWCESVERDASWDSWDHHYKSLHYNGGLQKARAVLTPPTEVGHNEG